MNITEKTTESVNLPVLENSQEPERIIVQDLLGSLRDSELKGIVLRGNAWAKEVRYDVDFMKTMSAFAANDAFKKTIEMVGSVAWSYNAMLHILSIEEETPSWRNKESVEERTKDLRRRWLDYFGGYLRRLLVQFDPVMRSRIVKYVSMKAGDVLREDGGTMFGMSVLPQEEVLRVVAEFGMIDFDGVPVQVHNPDLMVDGAWREFIGGVEANGACRAMKDELDGCYQLRRIPGRGGWYAALPITELVQVPDPTNHLVLRVAETSIEHADAAIEQMIAGAEAYTAANNKDGDCLVVGNVRVRVQIPRGMNAVAWDMDYKQVAFEDVIGCEEEGRRMMLICLRIVGDKQRPQVPMVKIRYGKKEEASVHEDL